MPTLYADEMRVRQMLLNLLSNAIKFTPKGSSVGLEVDLEEEYVLLSVWDEGIGISKDQQALLFQPFQQLDSTLSRRYEGTGLGLALTQRLARLHGGDIMVESEEEMGTRFTIHLPLDCRTVTQHDIQQALPKDASVNTNGDMPALSDIRSAGQVLVVEDNPINALLIEHMLNHWGYEAVHMPDGPTALNWLASNQPMLILMDVHLPGMDGIELTQKIRQSDDGVDIPIVATTALARPSDRDRCLEAGMQDYISKPINSAEFVSILAKYTWGQD
jgi:CheY-like chemotaxis protein/anti-sigma regulatory factor (Ser/Thr protein kinase)